MNMNPWHVEGLAAYERERIRRDMKQIRLEEEAMQAGRMEENTKEAGLSLRNLFLLVLSVLLRLRP